MFCTSRFRHRRFGRTISVIVTAMAIAFGCAKLGDNMNRQFADELEQLGFFKYADPSDIPALKREIAAQGWPGIFGETGRLLFADAEDLAEGGVPDFLRKVEPFLQKQGVILQRVDDHPGENDYSVSVNGTNFVIYRAQDIQKAERMPGLLWGLSTVRGFAIVNELLANAGSDERIYAVNGGNDLCGFFLTRELHQTICRHPDATPGDRPYLLKEEYPWFGQEHE